MESGACRDGANKGFFILHSQFSVLHSQHFEPMKKTLILGASTNPARYAYLVANKLVRKGHPIVNIGRKAGQVAGVEIEPADETKIHTDIDTVTVYVAPQHQPVYYDYLLKTNPKRVVFNPGAENPELREKLQNAGIETVEACTLVMLNTGQF